MGYSKSYDNRVKKPYNKERENGGDMRIGSEYKKPQKLNSVPEEVDQFQRLKADKFRKELEDQAKKVIENAKGQKNI